MAVTESEITEMTRISAKPMCGTGLNACLEHLSPQQILRWAVDTFGPRIVMTSAFGLNGVALIHMLQGITREVPIVFVDTGYLFEETLETKRRIESIYEGDILTYRSPLSVEEQARQYGPDLPIRQPELCCALRKVEPMRRAIAELRPVAVLNGRARFQASTRQALPIVEWEQTPIRINPLAFSSPQQIEAYVRTHDVPYNPLHDRGYPSIGCQPCTRPVLKNEYIRAGRWMGLDKIECGLWTTNYAVSG
jgi:phosphoadenosine phosphosulfate reductase